MQVKSLIASVGLGMVAGATAILMLPKQSEAYRMADDAARSLKQSADRMIRNITDN